ncbi:MAG: hypothetical protein ACHRHE_08710 [Tepidisphaerales bacterium]
MRDVRLWIAASLVAVMAGCAEMGTCAHNTSADEPPASSFSISGCGVQQEAVLDTGTVVRPSR